VTPEERKKILAIKKKAKYRETPKKYQKKAKTIKRRFRRQRVDILAKAWMTYIDCLGIDKYRPKQFNYHKTKGGTQCLFRDNLFTIGERAAITKYLRERDLITLDDWQFYTVQWRNNNGQEKEEAEESTQCKKDENHPEEQPLARIR